MKTKRTGIYLFLLFLLPFYKTYAQLDEFMIQLYNYAAVRQNSTAVDYIEDLKDIKNKLYFNTFFLSSEVNDLIIAPHARNAGLEIIVNPTALRASPEPFNEQTAKSTFQKYARYNVMGYSVKDEPDAITTSRPNGYLYVTEGKKVKSGNLLKIFPLI